MLNQAKLGAKRTRQCQLLNINKHRIECTKARNDEPRQSQATDPNTVHGGSYTVHWIVSWTVFEEKTCRCPGMHAKLRLVENTYNLQLFGGSALQIHLHLFFHCRESLRDLYERVERKEKILNHICKV